ncbi:hypothetical protein MRX96_003973 [Rhipicephalus microplus]
MKLQGNRVLQESGCCDKHRSSRQQGLPDGTLHLDGALTENLATLAVYSVSSWRAHCQTCVFATSFVFFRTIAAVQGVLLLLASNGLLEFRDTASSLAVDDPQAAFCRPVRPYIKTRTRAHLSCPAGASTCATFSYQYTCTFVLYVMFPRSLQMAADSLPEASTEDDPHRKEAVCSVPCARTCGA